MNRYNTNKKLRGIYKLGLILLIFLVLAVITSKAQTSGSTASRIRSGTSLPSTCEPTGSNIFYKSDTGVLYTCTASNTWTAIGGGGGANPAGSGLELQYRLDATTFGAVTSSSVTGGAISLNAVLSVNVSDTADAAITDLVSFRHTDTNSPTTGFGTGILLMGSNDNAASAVNMARIATVWADASASSVDSDIVFQLRTANAALAEKYRFSGLGNITIAGTPTITASATNAGIILAPNGTGDVSVMNGNAAFSVFTYGGRTDDSNYIRTSIHGGANFGQLALEAAGSFVGENILYITNSNNASINFQTNGSTHLSLSNNGHLLFSTDNTNDIGASGATRPRNVYVGSDLIARSVRGTAVAFASLPASPVEGMLIAVTDSSTATWGATITGGGANHVLAYYNGTNWTVAAK